MDPVIPLLSAWLPEQRWFAAKGVELQQVSIARRSRIDDDLDGATVDHLIIEVHSALGVQHYQLFVGWRLTGDPELEQVADRVIGEDDGLVGYDALHEPAVTAALLRGLHAGQRWGDIELVPEPGARFDATAVGKVISGEQSNTSIIYRGAGILKVYRRLEPGINPDVQIHRGLYRAGSFYVARPLAVMLGELDGAATTLGFLSTFFSNATDGWDAATASVRALSADSAEANAGVSADFSSESRRLGTAVAEVHRDLGSVFGVVELSTDAWDQVVTDMIAEAQRVAAIVPSVAQRLDRIQATFEQARTLSTPVVVQRVHGDLHLGQTLRTPTGWAVIDFEGEPAKTITERLQPQLLAKDIAGMLRSFDYAANHLLPGHPEVADEVARAHDWATINRNAFLAGYSSAASAPPLAAPAVITAFELDKAVYEVAYEHSNRPTWEPIPLKAIDALIGSAAAAPSGDQSGDTPSSDSEAT